MTDSSSSQMLTEGQTIQWYRVEEVLGRGGFGITYLAMDNNLDHRVAIKEYFPATLVKRRADKSVVPVSAAAEARFSEGLERFQTEARTLVKFRHPNIVRVMAVFAANNTAYLVMEYEEGERFKEAVTENGGADELTLKSLLLDVIDGLEQVHQHGFIHRDIKPVNIIIRRDGSPVLLDFGASRVLNRDHAAPATSFVSAGFTPLEQYQEGAGMALGPWTDIYSLAATLYYAISGQTPVSAVSRLAAFVKKSTDPLVPATEKGHGKYSDEFLEAIDWGLQFKTTDRPQTLAQWREAIVSSAPGEAGVAERKSRSHMRGNVSRRSQPLADREVANTAKSTGLRRKLNASVLIGALMLTAIGVGGWSWYRNSLEQQRMQQEINQLLTEADSEFQSESYLTTARPLYRQVLEVSPQNQQAIEQIEAIDQRAEESIIALVENQQFDAALLLLSDYASVQPTRASALQRQLEHQRARQALQTQLDEAEAELDAGDYRQALELLGSLRAQGEQNEKIASLEQRARTEFNEQQARQQRVEAQRLAREKEVRLENERLLAEANERQRQRRSDYRQYINSAKRALENDDINTARQWFNSASSMQISDRELTDLKTRLEAAEKFLQTPLSDYEISYARGQFNALRQAIEFRNLSAMQELVGSDSNRVNLFRTLFDRYAQISAKVLNVEPALSPKRVTATLRIEKMVLPNGDIVYPSASYRDSALSIERQRYAWSPIRW